MYDWLPQFNEDAFCVKLATTRATEVELTTVEQALGVVLPPSYKAFLRRWNGGEFNGDEVFSTTQLLEAAAEYGFRPYAGRVERTLGDNILYQAKPAHCLPFCSMVLSADVYCFDCRPLLTHDYAVCLYDHEVADLDQLLRPVFPSFEAFLLAKAFDLTGDLEHFLDEDEDEDDEVKELDADAKCTYWEAQLREMLRTGGADFSQDEWSMTWQNWQGTRRG